MIRILLSGLVCTAFALSFMGCAGPRTNEDFRKYAHGNSTFMDTREYDVAGLSVGGAESRLRAFGNKCYQKIVKSKVVINGAGHTTTSIYHPSLSRDKGRVTFILQRHDDDGVGMPPDGFYEFIVEVTAGANGAHVFASRFKPRQGVNILEDSESWLRGQGQFCPENI